jgi:hypothetical protein
MGDFCPYNIENFHAFTYNIHMCHGFMMITQHNASIHYNFDTLKIYMKMINIVYNIYH